MSPSNAPLMFIVLPFCVCNVAFFLYAPRRDSQWRSGYWHTKRGGEPRVLAEKYMYLNALLFYLTHYVTLSRTFRLFSALFVASLKEKVSHVHDIHSMTRIFFTLENGYWSVTDDAQIHITMCPCHTCVCHTFARYATIGYSSFKHELLSPLFFFFYISFACTKLSHIHKKIFIHIYTHIFCRRSFLTKSWFEIYATYVRKRLSTIAKLVLQRAWVKAKLNAWMHNERTELAPYTCNVCEN